MATGGYTEGKHSEEVLDFLCSPCSTKDKNKKADKFCETCSKYYCTRCLAYHDEIFTDHDQLGPEEFASLSNQAVLLPTQRCGRHRNELLQMYCKDHDVVVCNTCVSMQHRSCKAVIHIPVEVKSLLSTITIETVKTGLSTTRTTLNNDKQTAGVSLKKLNDKKNAIIESVEIHGESLKAIIDDLVNKSKREIDKQFHIIREEFQKKVANIEEDLAEIDKSIKTIEQVEKQKNDAQLFVSMKKCQATMTESQKHHADLTTWTNTLNFEYDINKEIVESLRSFTLMGTVNVQHTNPYLYTVKGMRKVKVCQDWTQCRITSLCQLPDGTLLAADYSHKTIARLDISCDKIIDQCPVSGTPYAVCLTGDEEAAVSLWDCQTIQFVSVGTKMALTRSVRLQHSCKGLAFSLGELFVSNSGDEVLVYDTAGNPLRTLGIITPEKREDFKGTDHIAVSSDGQKVYVSHFTMNIFVCMDRNGKELFTFKDSQLKGTRGIQTNDCDIFVCGEKSNNIIQLTSDGQKLGVLLNASNGIRKPASVSFDSKNKRLLVSKFSDSSFSIYELK